MDKIADFQHKGEVLGEKLPVTSWCFGLPHGKAKPRKEKRSDFVRQLILIFVSATFCSPCFHELQQQKTCPRSARERGVRRIRVTASKKAMPKGSESATGLHDAAVRQNQGI